VSYGALYYAAWEPFGTSVQAIADGASDAYITKFAKAVRNFGDPIALSFGHEMNGNWYPWERPRPLPPSSSRPGGTSMACSRRPGRTT
jgi:hypothetical protein